MRGAAKSIEREGLYPHAYEGCPGTKSATLEELNRTFVTLGGGAAPERPQVPPPTGLRILLARIQAIVSRRQFSDHGRLRDAAALDVERNCLAIE